MKRIILIAAIFGLLLATSGCSNGFLRGGLIGAGRDCCGASGNGLFGGNVLPSNFLQDGPVRQWLRGDACDSCNVPAGQISIDSGLGANCEGGNCFGATSPVISRSVPGPVVSQPAANYYPSFDQNATPLNSLNENQFFDGVSDNVELPPLIGN